MGDRVLFSNRLAGYIAVVSSTSPSSEIRLNSQKEQNPNFCSKARLPFRLFLISPQTRALPSLSKLVSLSHQISIVTMSDFDNARLQFVGGSLPPVERAAMQNSFEALKSGLERGMVNSQTDIFDLAKPFFSNPELGAVNLVRFTNALIRNWSDIAKGIMKSIESVMKAIQKAWSDVKTAVRSFFEWLAENMDLIVKILHKILLAAGGYLVGAGAGASIGASAGIIFGPLGAGVGAMVGGAVGGTLGSLQPWIRRIVLRTE
ncbi:hypothetical protein TWF481_007616 [Arthrobotrys musiformis]|uniref:Uncharacterized protein n=1 Tax=Arthrobotrys musiformis TaxID=47236 RepID=A0AAV9WE97_9PEZI